MLSALLSARDGGHHRPPPKMPGVRPDACLPWAESCS